MNMGTCVYCGKYGEVDRDHVPPRCFFIKPHPVNMITVSACEGCHHVNCEQDDTDIRNLIISIRECEGHRAVAEFLGGKRDRSLVKDNKRLQTMQSRLTRFYEFTPNGIEEKGIFDLDTALVNRFMDRVARGLLHWETSCGYVPCMVKWGLSERRQLLAPVCGDDVGDVFSYRGWRDNSGFLWLMRFYNGAEFLALLRYLPTQTGCADIFRRLANF